MNTCIINDRVYLSIWKQKNSNTAKVNNKILLRYSPAYRDPTANAAIDNIVREEQKNKRKKRPKSKRNKRK